MVVIRKRVIARSDLHNETITEFHSDGEGRARSTDPDGGVTSADVRTAGSTGAGGTIDGGGDLCVGTVASGRADAVCKAETSA
jgi:hypothetical protein